jgi:hypothetical protein
MPNNASARREKGKKKKSEKKKTVPQPCTRRIQPAGMKPAWIALSILFLSQDKKNAS